MTRVCVIGHFGEGKTLLNGQTIKTNMITEELQRQLGCEQVIKVDTHGGWKVFLKSPFQVLYALKNSKNVIIFPAHNGLRVYAPLLTVLKPFFKGRKIHYVVIGGWLPRFLSKRKMLAGVLKKFNGIYVETNTMKSALHARGFENIYVIPNCKNLKVLSEQELIYPSDTPYRLCTFSRVMQEKGIEDAVNAVMAVNESLGRTACTLDIYGQIEPGQEQWFEELQACFPEYIRYGGLVPYDKSVEVLKDYYALLFPTHFYTEGIPGTMIDAYAAGVPVISAKWENFADVVEDGVTGIGYPFEDQTMLIRILFEVIKNPENLQHMKYSCMRKANLFTPEAAIQILIDRMSED